MMEKERFKRRRALREGESFEVGGRGAGATQR